MTRLRSLLRADRRARHPVRALALLLLLPGAAVAQGVGTEVLRGLAPEAGPTGGDPVAPAPGSGGAVAPAPQDGASIDLPFVTGPDLRARTVAQHVRRLRTTDPLAAETVARELARHDYDAIFRGFLAGTELRADDAGDVLAAFVALQWMVANDARVEPSPAALRAIRRRFAVPLADRPPLSQPAARAAFAEEMKLRAVLHHAGWQAAKRTGTLSRFLATLPSDLLASATLRTLALTDEGLVPRGRSTATRPDAAAPPVRERPARPTRSTPQAEPETPAVPLHAANWDGVEGVYFRSSPRFGVGGMMIMDFEPLVLFRDGTTYEIGRTALEDVDLAAERTAKPRSFGRWTRRGAAFVLTDEGGRSEDYKLQDGRFFQAFPAPAGDAFTRSYRRISGGGNTAMGGDVMVAVSSRYDFRTDRTYDRGGSVGATNSGATSGVSSALAGRRAPEAGRYALDRHTLTLTGADGRVRRLFFAFSSEKDPPRIDRDMVFVGDTVFTSSR